MPDYEMAAGPAAMPWDEYAARVEVEWRRLLESAEGRDEKRVQTFLESHPCMVPGAFGFPAPSGHFPYWTAVITQPSLQGVFKRLPDFMWICSDSETIQPVLVEIEAPHKRWFTRGGVPHAHLNQARLQLAEWRDWISNPAHRQVFCEAFEVPDSERRKKGFKPFFVLVYGRRSELDAVPDRNRLRMQLRREDEIIMTFDRLSPEPKAEQLICIAKRSDGFKAVSVPATFQLGPVLARERHKIGGIAEAVRANTWILEDRKSFLLQRLPYWDQWVQDRRRTRAGLPQAISGDWE